MKTARTGPPRRGPMLPFSNQNLPKNRKKKYFMQNTGWPGPCRSVSYEPVRHDPGHAAFFMTCEIELNTKNSTRRQQSCHLVEFLVFNSAFCRYRRWLRSKRISKGRPRRIIIWYQILSFFAAEMLEKTQISHIFWLRAPRRVLRSVFDVPSFNLFAAEILIYPLQTFYGGNLIVRTLKIYRWC